MKQHNNLLDLLVELCRERDFREIVRMSPGETDEWLKTRISSLLQSEPVRLFYFHVYRASDQARRNHANRDVRDAVNFLRVYATDAQDATEQATRLDFSFTQGETVAEKIEGAPECYARDVYELRVAREIVL